MNVNPRTAKRFIDLFGGYEHAARVGAFGTGRGQWIKRNLMEADVIEHLEGRGPGIGLGPLGPGNCVRFAAIDLDESDFNAAYEMQSYLPGSSFLERSRSGNAHVWVLFSDAIEAYIPMGILREATLAAGKKHVEVFPKNHDFEKVKYGNYINLPFHGNTRCTLECVPPEAVEFLGECAWSYKLDDSNYLVEQWLERFLGGAENGLNDPEKWRARARWLLLEPPERRESQVEFGQQPNLHICAQHLLDNADSNPVVAGHRSVVYFSLAKMLLNCSMYDEEEALMLMRSVNQESPDPIEDRELRRILGNAARGAFTSTGCDDPLFIPYASPDCRIAYGSS